MKLFAAGLAALLGVALGQPASAQARLFSDTTPITITISAPMATLVQRAPRSTAALPGTVTVAGAPQELPIQIAARGLTRRVAGVCSFPPIRLDFDPHTLAGTIFEGQHRLKLVDPCQHGSNYEQLVVLEYLAYRLNNVITPVSYRVRPVRVTFHDTDHRRADDAHFGYLIEEVDDVAHRNHLHALNVASNALNAAQLNGVAASRIALFEYMISNLDWDMLAGPQGESCCHNTKLLAATAETRTDVVPVPYDFDYSGLVDAPYAVAPSVLHVNNVRTRYFRGYCRYSDQLTGVIGEFQAHKNDLFAMIDNEPALDEGHRRAAHAYLQDFFNTLDNPAAVQRNLTTHCRGG